MQNEIINKIKNDKDVQHEVQNAVLMYNNQNLSTKEELGRNMLIKNTIYNKAIYQMGDTIADMDIEIEEKDSKINYLEKKIGITDKEIIKEMSNKGIKLIKEEDRNKRILKRLNKNNEKHKQLMKLEK